MNCMNSDTKIQGYQNVSNLKHYNVLKAHRSMYTGNTLCQQLVAATAATRSCTASSSQASFKNSAQHEQTCATHYPQPIVPLAPAARSLLTTSG